MDRSPAQTALLPASQALDPSRSVPAVLERAGANALFAADEFFAARISNPHTRRAYARVVRRFLAWCEEEHLEFPQVSPGLAGRFIDELPGDSSTKNQALAALRHFFDTLVTRHAAPLNPFHSALGKQKQLSPRPLSANSMGLMLKRRLKDAGLPPIFSPHSFRVLVVTDLLSQDVPLEDVQYLAGHANPRTTQIYDRRRRRVTRNIVERISV